MLLVLGSHDVQDGNSYDVDFVRRPLHLQFLLELEEQLNTPSMNRAQ